MENSNSGKLIADKASLIFPAEMKTTGILSTQVVCVIGFFSKSHISCKKLFVNFQQTLHCNCQASTQNFLQGDINL